MVQTSNHSSDLVHVSQMCPWLSCFSTTAIPGTRKVQKLRHSKDRETPFPVYIGLSVFAKTRKKYLVELLHENGISVSYDRVLEISAQLGEAILTQYTEDGVVCPPVLRKGLFTTSAMDNIDHNPTATTATTWHKHFSLSTSKCQQ